MGRKTDFKEASNVLLKLFILTLFQFFLRIVTNKPIILLKIFKHFRYYLLITFIFVTKYFYFTDKGCWGFGGLGVLGVGGSNPELA
jgi:hypothetical protein